MLTKTAIESTYGVAAKVTRAGKVLSVNKGTVLHDLVDCCPQRGFELPSDEPSPSLEDLVVEASCASSDMDTPDHDIAHERAVELGSKAVAFVFDLARNVVTPQIKKVADETEAYVINRLGAAREPLIIDTVFMGDVFRSMSLVDMVARFKDATPSSFPPVQLTAAWPGSVIEALGTGDSVLDGAVSQHFATKEDSVKTLWESVFSNVPGQYRDSDLFKVMPNLDTALVVFLGAQKLIDSEVPEGLTVDLATYRSYLASLIEFAGVQLNRHSVQSQTQTQQKVLVISKPMPAKHGATVSGVIQVNGEVYNRWLAEGGSPEALMGAVAVGDPTTYDSILADADAYAAAWKRQLALIESTAGNELRAATISGLRQALIALGTELADAGVLPTDMEDAIEKINERLSHFHPDDVRDVYRVARKAVCRVFYYHTPVEKILVSMESVAANNPAMDLREAALLVMIDYVAGWLADEIVVSAAEAPTVKG